MGGRSGKALPGTRGLLTNHPRYAKTWQSKVDKMLRCRGNLETCLPTHGREWIRKMWEYYRPRLQALLQNPPKGEERNARAIAKRYDIKL